MVLTVREFFAQEREHQKNKEIAVKFEECTKNGTAHKPPLHTILNIVKYTGCNNFFATAQILNYELLISNKPCPG